MIARLRELLAKATPGEWRQGITLRTRITSKWSEEQLKACDVIERRNVFRSFHNEDEGRSRKRIAQFDDESEASLIVAAVNALPALLDALEAAKEMNNHFLTFWRTHHIGTPTTVAAFDAAYAKLTKEE